MQKNIDPQSILFSFSGDVMQTIKNSEYTPWEIACEISDQMELSRAGKDSKFEKISEFTYNDTGIIFIRLAYGGLAVADINPHIGLTLSQEC